MPVCREQCLRTVLPCCAAVLLSGAFSFGVRAADVGYFGVIKSAMYTQEPGGTPQLWSSNAFGFNAFTVANTNSVLTNATLKLSSSAVVRSLTPETNDVLFRYEQWFATQSALDAAYPGGTLLRPESYQLTMHTRNDGVHTASLSFTLLFIPLSYPSTPHLSNLPAGQSIDTTRDFELQWQPLSAGLAAIVQVLILDASSNIVFASAAPFQPGALTASSTSIVIPAYTLPPGNVLQGHLSVGNPGTPNTDGYPGATGVAALGKDTQFPLVTRPAPLPPTLMGAAGPSGTFNLEVQGETNRLLRLQGSTDGRSWADLHVTNSSAFSYVDPIVTNSTLRLYRVAVGQAP